nr:hypothetical protein [Tanacetum cinerariifolium]
MFPLSGELIYALYLQGGFLEVFGIRAKLRSCPPQKNVNHRDLRDVEIDDLRRQVQHLQEELARVKVVNDEDEVHDDDSDGEEKYDNPFGSSSAFDSGHSSRQHQRVRRSRHDFDFNVDIPEFDGKIQPDEFLYWLHTVEKVFDFKEVSEDRKVKLVAIKLQKHAGLWWENLKMRRVREVEKQQKEKRGSFIRSFNKEGSTSNGKTRVIASKVPVKNDKQVVGSSSNGVRKCFKCQGYGHIASECPNRKVITLMEEDIIEESAIEVCNVIIDGGSCSNVVATSMVEKLQLKIEDHPRPYNIHWIRKGNEVKVNKRVIHDGYKNTYSFITNGVRVVLTPLKPETLLPCVKEKDVSFISGACIEKQLFESQMGYVLVVMEESRSRIVEHNPLVRTILEDFKDAAYSMNPKEHEELLRQVDELLKKGVLQESKSPCAIPALLVKKDGSWCMCVDIRAINQITIKYRFPIPRLDDLLHQLFGAIVFSKIDLRSGYHQIRIRPGDEWKTAFKTKSGIFEWLVMPFGLSNAPRIEVDHEKVEAILNWPVPKNIHDVRSFHAQKTFGIVKRKMAEAPVLVLPDFEKIFDVKCDASNVGIGGVLSQGGKPVAFFSEKLMMASENIPHMIKSFMPLFALLSIEHKAGKLNKVADALSRRHCLLQTMKAKVLGFEVIKDLYDDDCDFGTTWKSCCKGLVHDFLRYEGFLFKSNRLCVLQCSLREEIIRETHEGGLAGHFGRDKTLAAVQEKFVWPKMGQDVKRLVDRPQSGLLGQIDFRSGSV